MAAILADLLETIHRARQPLGGRAYLAYALTLDKIRRKKKRK